MTTDTTTPKEKKKRVQWLEIRLTDQRPIKVRSSEWKWIACGHASDEDHGDECTWSGSIYVYKHRRDGRLIVAGWAFNRLGDKGIQRCDAGQIVPDDTGDLVVDAIRHLADVMVAKGAHEGLLEAAPRCIASLPPVEYE